VYEIDGQMIATIDIACLGSVVLVNANQTRKDVLADPIMMEWPRLN
jgi:hypothetical protein